MSRAAGDIVAVYTKPKNPVLSSTYGKNGLLALKKVVIAFRKLQLTQQNHIFGIADECDGLRWPL